MLKHRTEAIDEWARALRERFSARPLALVLELTKGPNVYALGKYDFIVLFPINPASLAKYRKVFTHSGAKDDPTDAELGLDFLLKHPERLEPLRPQSTTMRALEQFVEMRRNLAEQLVDVARRRQDSGLDLAAHRSLGYTVNYSGHFQGSRSALERVVSVYDTEVHGDYAFRYGGVDRERFDPGGSDLAETEKSGKDCGPSETYLLGTI